MKNKYEIIYISMVLILLIIIANSLACYFGGKWFYIFYHLCYGIILSLFFPIWYVKTKEYLTYSSFGIKKIRLKDYMIILAFVAFSIGGQLINLDYKSIRFDLLSLSVAPLLMTTFFEEFLFRGFMQTRFENAFGYIPAIILSGFAFSIYHLGYSKFRSISEIVLLFFVGVMFAIAFKVSNNNLIVSYFVNLPNVLVTYLVKYEKFPTFDLTSTTISIIVIFIIILVLKFRFRGDDMSNKKIISSILITMVSLSLFTGCSSANKKNSRDEVKTSTNISSTNNSGNESKSNSTTISSGLLIGLSYDQKDNGNNDKFNMPSKEFRTLWIYHDGSKVILKEKDKSIVVPYKDNFYEIKNDSFQFKERNEENKSEDFYLKYKFYYSWNNIVSKIIGSTDKHLFTEKSFKDKYTTAEGDFPFKSNIESVSYIGNNYACINSDYYETGGGTYRSGKNDIKLFDIGNLGNMNYREKTEKLYNLLNEDVKKEIKAFENKKNNEFKAGNGEKNPTFIKVEKVVDIDNLSLGRKEGKWIVQIPVYERYSHEGNGSNAYKITEFIPYQCKLPKSITSYDSLCLPWANIKKVVPDAVDAISSPKEDLMAVITKKQILIFVNPKEDMKEADLKIPLKNNEVIISNQWAVGSYVEKWNNELGKVFK